MPYPTKYQHIKYSYAEQPMDPCLKSALLVGAGFVVGCQLGCHFLSGIVILVIIGAVVHYGIH